MLRSTPGLMLVGALFACGGLLAAAQSHAAVAAPLEDVLESRVDVLPTGERILVEVLEIEAPVAEVWAAYTTEAGYTAWAAPKAEVDLRVGGRSARTTAPGPRSVTLARTRCTSSTKCPSGC